MWYTGVVPGVSPASHPETAGIGTGSPCVSGLKPVNGVSVAKTAGIETEEAVGAGSSKLFWCSCIKRWLPLVYREELYHLLRLSGPLLLSRILFFLLPLAITIFSGHIGNTELAGYALASAIINVTTSATGFGLALACDTLISQTYGSKNLKYVGVILQRSSLILLLFCIPCWALLINSYHLLRLLQQEDEVARIAHLYIMIFLPAVPAMFLHNLQVTYLQNQGIILPQMYTALAANILNIVVNYVLIFSLEFGVVGSAIANSLSQITVCLLLFGYIKWKKLHVQTWGGWSIECLQEWGSYMRLALPSLLMVCFEWWAWEIGGFFAGMLGEVDLGAQHVMTEIAAIVFMFPLGIHVATSVRVGNALGAGNTAGAIVTFKVALVLAGVLAVFQGVNIACFKSIVGYVFTSDEEIVGIVSENLTVYIFLQFFESLLCACTGLLIGAGMQKLAAISNLVAYYCMCLPMGIALMFKAQLRILGLWLSLLTCNIFETVLFLLIIYKLNWKKVTHKAELRTKKKILATPNRPIGVVLNEEMVPDISDCRNRHPRTLKAQLDVEEDAKADGYLPVDTQDQEQQVGHVTESSSATAVTAEGGDGQSKNTCAKTQVPLSVTQLVLRRGITFLVSILILAVGIFFNIWFPIPDPAPRNGTNFTLAWANDSTPEPSI
ncbi:multidrug and toxin extrusion protein 1 [Antennarius striatus]|uniref:multidrug and toxin extrusion protein 1 n=1 Tax=Antennarius striatus TaxID=241820 RepID=UPI0035B42F51